jgi:hypothetical protein
VNIGIFKTFARLSLPFAALAITVAGCGLNEFREQEERLSALVDRGATKQDLVTTLGSNYLAYSVGETNWHDLVRFLQNEPTNRLVAVRKAVVKWPNVMLYSTPDMMTWVFLDTNHVIVDFVVGAQ